MNGEKCTKVFCSSSGALHTFVRYPHYTLFRLKKKGFRPFFCALTNGQQKFCFCFCAVLKIYCSRSKYSFMKT
ncbi:hypothetical protein HMPREF9436_00014 [Faecalibacterium cf. prausnitzii KLE1255]|uniref:Uncharacterized protein n=1 Tax=Faecalibacterium cf. prausnitzii KLE1255 TaxID=748224 RepID=E2ZEE0_9FIRM|nr:hypothetical protein HMPREF9436_00014 [Faecalibacterium cf. prausnitzii KLE1255]